MNIIEETFLDDSQKRAITDLWNKEYPLELSLADITDFEHYLQTLKHLHHILLVNGEDVKGWLIYFERDDEQCFAMLLDSSLQRQGWGSKLLDLAKQRTFELNGWVIDGNHYMKQDGTNYKSPIGFYLKNDFELRPDSRLKKNGIDGIKVTWKSKG